MNDSLTSQRERLTKLVIGLLLFLLIAIGITWPHIKTIMPVVFQPLPTYPNAQEQSVTIGFKQLHVCTGDGESNEVVVRTMRFLTSDPPDAVRQFYRTILVDQGTYIGRSQTLAGIYDETFEQVVHQATSLLDPTHGIGVRLRSTSGLKHTTVFVQQYRYEKLQRACHLWGGYDKSWEP